jgi:metabolite-proton symporter
VREKTHFFRAVPDSHIEPVPFSKERTMTIRAVSPDATALSRERRKAVLASTVGTSIEYYDFFLYGSMAAAVFPTVFFPHSTPLSGVLQSFATFAVGFVARPIGGAVFGHLGDRLGRKHTLILTLSLMGAGTVLMGLVPGYGAIGAWGGLALVILRFLQGMGVGGEWGGSVLLAMEWAPPHRRGLASSFPQAAVPIGLILSNGVIAILLATTSHEQFLAWGWRIPFLASFVLFGVGLYIRKQVTESPVFAQVADTGPERRPLLTVLRRNWREVVLCALVSAPDLAMFYVSTVFVFTFAEKRLGLTQSFVTVAVVAGAVVSVFAIPFFGFLSDRVGRHRMYFLGLLTIAVWVWVYFGLFSAGTALLAFLAIVLAFIPHAMGHGPQGALLAESFPGRVRYSGASLGYQLASVLAGGPAPLIALWLFSLDPSGFAIAAYLMVLALIGMAATVVLRDRVRRTAPVANAAEQPPAAPYLDEEMA